MSFYVSQQAGSLFNQSQFFTSSNHFQVHGAVGVKLYVKSDIFIKPQFDIHWVDNLTDQYGRNAVPEYTISIGYTFGQTVKTPHAAEDAMKLHDLSFLGAI